MSYLFKKNWDYKLEERRLEKETDAAQLQHPMNEKLQELELLLESRDRKIHFLQEEHKQEVKRASHAEETTNICRLNVYLKCSLYLFKQSVDT